MTYRPKKRFGQNFLRDHTVVERIISAAGLDDDSRVLEIGPGLGVLTERLLERSGEVHVMEVDRDLVARLLSRKEAHLLVHEGDCLELDWVHLLPEPPYTLVANLPYNISSQVVFKILDHRHLFRRCVLMFQKEVADRLAADPGTKDYGILSVFCRLWFDIRRIATVPPGAFSPPPKVTSAVLAFEPLDRPRVVVEDEPFFRKVVKGAFAQRRKTLRNTLTATGFGDGLEEVLAATGIDPGRRGETLSLEEFSRLSQALREQRLLSGD
jgi:16S rRNA (adenine1518-N6/adenine1519-N6)-dimethyltransferase